MELRALRMYYRAAVIVPFYTICFFVIVALLTGTFISYILWTEADWQELKVSKGDLYNSTLLFVIFFIHLMELAISYIDIRGSIIKTSEREQEEKNEVRTIYR